MDRAEIFYLAIGVVGALWAIISTLTGKYTSRQEADLQRVNEKLEKFYSDLIETQKENTKSTHMLSEAVNKLSGVVTAVEKQSAERHDGLLVHIKELHDTQELVRLRIHWIINKLTVIKFAMEAAGKNLGGDWESP